jgi:hypothetical protein
VFVLTRLMRLAQCLRSRLLACPVFALRAPRFDDLPISSWARRLRLDGGFSTELKSARGSGNDLGEVPGSRNAYRSWRARPTEGVGCPEHHASHHDELGHYFALRSHSARYSIGILRLVAT